MREILRRKKRTRSLFAILILASVIIMLLGTTVIYAVPPPPAFLDPKTIPKYGATQNLAIPPVYTPDLTPPTSPITAEYTVEMVSGTQQILPLGTVVVGGGGTVPIMTTVWGYQSPGVANFFSPSATFEAKVGQPIRVKWVNKMIATKQLFAVDPTLYWANPWKWNPNNPNALAANAFPDGDAFSKTGAVSGVFLPYPNGYDASYNLPFPPYSLNAQQPVPLVPHLHGAEVPGEYDGGPESWWTAAGAGGLGPNQDLKGPNYYTAEGTDLTTTTAGQAWYDYPNSQEPTTLWYHDHALGITRINVMSGLAGFYLLRDPTPWNPATTAITSTNLDSYLTATFTYGINEIPLAIQDRTFKNTGELWFPEVGLNPLVHPYWMPEFFGNTIMVNGKVWPKLDVTPGWYRFRLLDGSNARFYTLSFSNGMSFTVIGADGGYLRAPATVKSLTIAPGERADVLVQFTQAMVGKQIILTNTAKTPFPNGANPDPQTTGQIMAFNVIAGNNIGVPNSNAATPVTTAFNFAWLPTAGLNPTQLGAPGAAWPFTPAGTTKKYITLNEVMGAAGPVMSMINGQYYHADAKPALGQVAFNTANPLGYLTPVTSANIIPHTSVSQLGRTEEWVIVNLTADTHPIHLHLVTFQVVSRQKFQAAKYQTDWLLKQVDPVTKNPLVPPFPEYYEPIFLDPTPYLQSPNGAPVAPGTGVLPTEMGWKDTIQMNPGEVTVIRVRFTPQDGVLPFFPSLTPLDPTTGPGYVYHCHIIDHEDNEMMRPLIIEYPPV